ncbi:MAG: bifunctional metallophosphatase/5'-nucleotidase [Labilithrix sp.]|nr:bifunctional metallophosphatase/5'-nucleotidase [Labilithrix sp.]MCW5813706.1 bifunctional metallophosphatase/5'-nucleotidase [Labilithrix sp.]
MNRRALAIIGLAAVGSAAPVLDAGPPPAAPAPAAPVSGPAPDVLTIVKAKDADTPKAIGTCDPAQAKGAQRIGIAHVNDLQARYSDRIAGKSRYAYVAAYLKLLKTAQPTLVLDAGGDYEKGSIADLRSNGETTRQIVQAMPIDVRTLGDHDFGYGENVVLRDVRLSAHPVLAANVRHAGESAAKPLFRPWARFDVGCVKVGVIGLVTQNRGADDQPSSAPFDDVFQQDPRYGAVLEREAKAHRAEVDVLIALTHLGYADDLTLARKHGALVDVIVGGHGGDTLRDPGVVLHPPAKTKTWIVQAGHFGEHVGYGDIVVSSKEPRKVELEKYRMVDVDDKLKDADKAIDDLVKKLEDAVTPDAQKPIGKTNAAIARGKGMVDVVWRAAKEQWQLDALIVGKDLFAAGLPKGDVTLQRLYDAMLVQKRPAGSTGTSSIYVQEIQGDEASSLLRSFQPRGNYEWSGLQRFDPTKKYKIGFDKRAATYPKQLFGLASKAVRATFAGELIDVVEPWVRARAAKGQSIDP